MTEASQSRTLIEVREASKFYREGKVQALNGVSLSIAEGEFVSIVGQSGCGKSTLLNLIGALDLPSQGDVLFRGESLLKSKDLDRLRAQEIGFVFQSFYLLPNLTAEENVQLPMFEGSLSLQNRVRRAKELLERVGLGDRLNHLPDQLSNGQKQRVAIARALANEPAVVLADEPTGALDSKNGIEVIEVLAELNRTHGTTLIIVTHDSSIASRARRTIRMLDGKIVQEISC